MKKQVRNPFLPIDVCIPDGEPHVFGERLYLFGSHEIPGGNRFCCLDYEFFSAPVSDLSDWSSKGINYSAKQDPDFGDVYDAMYAPDVVQGHDGRFYLYYAMSGRAFTGPIHVAVCDTPDGKYTYYGAVRNPEGTVFNSNITFDPAVIHDNGIIRLYYGWSLAVGREKVSASVSEEELFPVYTMLFGKSEEQLRQEPGGLMGAFTVELDKDMRTVRTVPQRIVPGQFSSIGTDFEGHAFFEGSSIRKINDTYYFIYSSENQHELCYATSCFPDRGFRYGGVIVSNGDIGYRGRKEERIAATGNNHGSIECVNGQWYVFYHRHTHGCCFSRQACAEKIDFLPNGGIQQVCITSCGLSGEPIKPKGILSAAYCCGLHNKNTPHLEAQNGNYDIPAITHDDRNWFVSNMDDGTSIHFRWIAFAGKVRICIRYRGGSGKLCLVVEDRKIEKEIYAAQQWNDCVFDLQLWGKQELIISYQGNQTIDILELEFTEA